MSDPITDTPKCTCPFRWTTHYRTCPLYVADPITDTPHARWVKIGETLNSGEWWYSDLAAWMLWTMKVAEEAEERNAWFIVGYKPNLDCFVFDVLDPSRLRMVLQERNIRSVEFWREAADV